MHRASRPGRSSQFFESAHVVPHCIAYGGQSIDDNGFRGVDLFPQKVMQLACVADGLPSKTYGGLHTRGRPLRTSCRR